MISVGSGEPLLIHAEELAKKVPGREGERGLPAIHRLALERDLAGERLQRPPRHSGARSCWLCEDAA